MPAAPDYETIYDLEGAIEPACKTVLEAFGCFAFCQFEDADLPAERVDIQLRVGTQREHKSKIAGGVNWVRDSWNATLVFEIGTKRQRGIPGAHGRMRARVRMACEYFQDRFTAELLPYHNLVSITQQETDPQVREEDDLDISALHYSVVIGVRTGAWPTNFPYEEITDSSTGETLLDSSTGGELVERTSELVDSSSEAPIQDSSTDEEIHSS